MATTIPYKDTSYGKYHPRIDQYFLRNSILPELKKQGSLGDKAGRVKVSPDGITPEEYISLAEARALTLDFLTNTGNLPEKRQRQLQNAKSYNDFTNLAWAFFFDEVETPQSAVNPDVITEYAALQEKPNKAPVMMRTRFSADDRIKKYNELYKKILSYQYLGDTPRILNQIFPQGSKDAIDVEQYQLAQIIAANLSRLQAANNSSNDPIVKNHAVTAEINNIIAKSYPKAIGFINYTGNDQVKYAVRRIVDNFASFAESEDPDTLNNYEQSQIAASQAIREYTFNERELSAALNSTLSFIHNDKERSSLINNLLRENNKRLFSGQDLKSIVERLAPGSSVQILEEIEKRNLNLSLEQLNNNLRANLSDNEFVARGGLTKAEFNLLKNKGINPFLTTYTPWDKRFNVNKAKSNATTALLSTYNSENNKSFKNLEEAYAHESQKENPDPLFLLHARNHLNRNYYYGTLSDSERFSADLARVNRNFSSFVSRAQELQGKVIDGFVDLEETITGKKWLHKQLDRWDRFAEKYTIKVGKTDIPIFRIRNWVSTQWDKFKKLKIESWISSGSSASGGLGKFTRQRLIDYKLGGFSFKGMTSIGLHRAWSAVAYKATSGVIKGGTTFSLRTATRFFLKIGAKTLAKATYKLSQLAISGGLTLSGVLSALGIVLIVKDVLEIGAGLVKWAWNGIKDLFSRTDFGSTGILSALAMGWTAALGFVTSLLFPWVLPSIVSIGVFIGIVFGSVHYQTMMNQMLNTTARLDVNLSLDSGLGEFIGNILCDSGEGGGKNNSRIQTAACIAEILSKCSINPLTASNAQGSTWQCMLASTLAESALAQLQRSATSYSVLQCVGFIVAIDVANGGTGTGFGDAKTLLSSPPSGYKPVLGVGSCSPGDFFVDTTGTWGHTGVFIANGGATSQVADANGAGPGVVRGPGSGTWLSSKIAGCLKKI